MCRVDSCFQMQAIKYNNKPIITPDAVPEK